MTIDDASRALWREVHAAPWFRAIGVGEPGGVPTIFLYVARAHVGEMRRRYPSGIGVYPVRVEAMSKPRPAATALRPQRQLELHARHPRRADQLERDGVAVGLHAVVALAP